MMTTNDDSQFLTYVRRVDESVASSAASCSYVTSILGSLNVVPITPLICSCACLLRSIAEKYWEQFLVTLDAKRSRKVKLHPDIAGFPATVGPEQ